MPFYDWIDCINNANQGISKWNTSTTQTYKQLDKQMWKDLVYRNTYNKLLNIILKIFKWTTDCETIVPKAIELGYVKWGSVCMYKDDLGIWCLPCHATDKFNVYGEPLSVNVFGFNGYQKTIELGKTVSNKDGVLYTEDPTAIYSEDNDLTYPYEMYIRQYAAAITDNILALGVASNRLKTPFMYEVNDINLKDDVNKMVDMIENNDDIIIRVKQDKLKQQEDVIKPYNISIDPNSVMAIKELINFNFNMFLETIGINTNPSPDKSQVVLTSEINSNNTLIDIAQDIRYDHRKKLCDEASKILGITISVEKNTDELLKEINATRQSLTNGGDDNDNRPSNE